MLEKEKTFGELTDAPNANYEKFFAKFNEINSIPVENWKVVHLIGYFVKKYYDTYQISYKFKFNSQVPSKCFEVFQIKKLSLLLSSKPLILKEYIDWVFDNKVPKAKRRLTSISFLTIENTVNYYKNNILLENKTNNKSIDRTTRLPDKYIEIYSNIGYNISTYGDLAFLKQMPDMTVELSNAFILAQNAGLDLNLLTKIV